MGERARVVVSVTASVDGRVTLGRDRLLLSEEAGGGLNGALLREGLIDELHLVVLPTAIGGKGVPSVFDGRELRPDELPTQLRLLAANPTPDGVLSLRYEVVR